MRKISDPQLSEEEEKLVVRGRALAEKHIADFRTDPYKPIQTDSYYTKLKPILLRTHKEKCAYCETAIIRSDGDVEHFRPKQGVIDRNGRTAKLRLESGQVIDHPGYFWLTYDLRNLFMSCQHCNQLRNHQLTDGSGAVEAFGKGCYFPVSGEYSSIIDLDTDPDAGEKRLLINPRIDNFLEDFVLLDNGFLKPRTDRGEYTILRLGLNKQNLPEYRRRAIGVGRSIVTEALHSLGRGDLDVADKAELVERIFSERVPYTLAYWYGVQKAFQGLSQVFTRDEFYALMDKISQLSYRVDRMTDS